MKFIALTGAALLTIGLAGCTASPTETPSPGPDASSGTTSPSGGAPAECGGLSTESLNSIFGTELSGPDVERGDSDQNGISWTNTGCDWENEAADLEIDLDISGPADFAEGSIVCLEPGGSGTVTPVDGLGTQAWWEFEDSNEVEGELRVCTDDSLVELAVDAAAGSMSSEELLGKVTEAIRIVVG